MAAFTVAITAASLVTSARAQSNTPDMPGRVRLSVGIELPRDRQTRDLGGNVVATIGASFSVAHNVLMPNSELEIFADYDGGSKSTDFTDSSITATGTGQVHAFGIGPALRMGLGNPGTTHLFIDGGVGIYFSTAKFGVTATDGTNTANIGSLSHSSNGLGGRLLFGVEKGKGFFGEIGYEFAPSVKLDFGTDSLKLKPGGPLARFGYHFF